MPLSGLDDELLLRRTSDRHAAITAQDALLASLETLLEVHNVSLPPPKPPKWRVYDPPPTLERFSNLRIVTVTNVQRMAGASCLHALPVSVRQLTLDAGDGMTRCDTPAKQGGDDLIQQLS